MEIKKNQKKKGIPDGHVIELDSEGLPGHGLEIKTKKDAFFRRGERSARADLFVKIPVSLYDALYGCDIEFENLDGQTISLHFDRVILQ